MSDPPAVVLRGLYKVFGSTTAVDHIDLQIERHSFFGLLGPNGAGKTTTLRMTTGLLRPTTGSAYVDGVDVWADPVRAKALMGVLPDELPLFDRLTGAELLTYNGLLRDMDPAVVAGRSGELLRVLGLQDAARTMVVDYSHGMRKKIALAAALIHGPRVLFLDEPFEGIDPVSARVIRSVLQRLVRSGSTVVISSHVMEIVERLCDRIAILDRGRIVANGSVDELRGSGTLEDAFVALVGASERPDTDLDWLGA